MLSSINILHIRVGRMRLLTTSFRIDFLTASSSSRCQGSQSRSQNQLRIACKPIVTTRIDIALTFADNVQGRARDPRGHVDDGLPRGVHGNNLVLPLLGKLQKPVNHIFRIFTSESITRLTFNASFRNNGMKVLS
jgi:hypothetical protein